jgi:hypothetical protein
MSASNPLQSFTEDLAVFRQLTVPDERAEFTALMKRAYAQQVSACAFVRRSPERQVSARIRRLCEAALSQRSTLTVDDAQDNPGAASEDATNFSPPGNEL